MKEALVGTALGDLALTVRERIALHSAIRRAPETLDMLANGMIARRLLERICENGRTFIDVGAHIGSVIGAVRRLANPGRVVAIEANPFKADALRRKFSGIEVHACAAGEEESQASFFINVESSGYSSLDRHYVQRDANSAEVREMAVPVKRLDSIAPKDGVDLIKIDVVGAELGVLKGATAIVDSSRPLVVVECVPRPDDQLGALWQWFEDNSYALLVPNRVAHIDDGLARESFVEGQIYPIRSMNYFGVPKERRDVVRVRARRILGQS